MNFDPCTVWLAGCTQVNLWICVQPTCWGSHEQLVPMATVGNTAVRKQYHSGTDFSIHIKCLDGGIQAFSFVQLAG